MAFLYAMLPLVAATSSCGESVEDSDGGADGDASMPECIETTGDFGEECVAGTSPDCHTEVYCCACLPGCGSGSWVCEAPTFNPSSCPATPPEAGTSCDTLTEPPSPCTYCDPETVFAECVEVPDAGRSWIRWSQVLC